MSLSKFLPLRIGPNGRLTNQHKAARVRTRNRHEFRASLVLAERFNHLDVPLFIGRVASPEELSEKNHLKTSHGAP